MPKRKAQNKDKPWIENYPPLRDWLRGHEAFCQWQVPVGPEESPNMYVECWQVGKAQCIVTIYSGGSGWNIYTCSDDGRTDATLADASKRLGLGS
jgi:hypothetical protein